MTPLTKYQAPPEVAVGLMSKITPISVTATPNSKVAIVDDGYI